MPLSAVRASICGVVDQPVETAVGVDELSGGVDRRVVGEVEHVLSRAELFGGVAAAFDVLAADVDGVARGDQAAGGLEPETLVRSGDQCCRHASSLRHGAEVSQQSRLPRNGGTRQAGARGSVTGQPGFGGTAANTSPSARSSAAIVNGLRISATPSGSPAPAEYPDITSTGRSGTLARAASAFEAGHPRHHQVGQQRVDAAPRLLDDA